MKNIKQLISLLLALLLLSGCAVAPGGTEGAGAESTGTAQTDPQLTTFPPGHWDTPLEELKLNRQLLPEVVDNPENLPVLKWVCFMFAGMGDNCVWTEDAVIEFNQMLADRKLGYLVQLVVYTADKYHNPYLGFLINHPDVRQEDLQTADIIYGKINEEKVKELLMPITDYATGSAEPSLKNTVTHKAYWDYVTRDGEIYGVPTEKRGPTTLGWIVDKDLMKDVGLTDADFQKNFWEMDEVFEKIKNSGYNRFVTWGYDALNQTTSGRVGEVPSHFPKWAQYVLDKRYNRCGSVFGIDEETGKVVNILDTETARTFQQAANRYSKAGYLTDENNGGVIGKIDFAKVFAYEPCDTLRGNRRIIPAGMLTSYMLDKSTPTSMNGITKNSQRKEEALNLLKLLSEDEELMMQFSFGKEGRDYTLDEDGCYLLKRDRDSSADYFYYMGHLVLASYFAGFVISKESAYVPNMMRWDDSSYENKSTLESDRELWEHNAAFRCEVVLDYSGFINEAVAIQNLCKARFSGFSTMTPEKYDQMIADFNSAGADRILASLQKQYDQWKKDNPDKVN